MVDDINFPKGLPPISAADRVQKVNRKKREEEKPPFEKFLDPEDQKEKKEKKKESDKVDILGQAEMDSAQNLIESAGSTAGVEEDESEKKRIDVRV